MKMGDRIPDSIIVLGLRSLSGEVTKNMRMVALQYDGNNALFRFYMSKAPTDDELETGEIVAANFDAGHPTPLRKLDVEFEVTDKPLGQLDSLGFGLFRRNEELE